MILSLVVAMGRNRVIGHNATLPWHLPADLRHFKRITWGKPLLMGRTTHESIGRPLPGRHNIVLSRNPNYRADGCTIVSSLDAALAAAGEAEELMIIGGAEIFQRTLPLAARIHLTEVQAEPPGDTFFPEIDATDWRERSREDHPADERNPHVYSFVVLERRNAASVNSPASSTSPGRSP